MNKHPVRSIAVVAVVAVCLALLALPAAGENDSRAEKPPVRVLSGMVVDGNDQPVAAARVYWQAADGRGPHFLRTDAEGRFRSGPVRAGLYDIRAQAKGLWSDWHHNVLVRSNAGAEVTLRLVRKAPPER